LQALKFCCLLFLNDVNPIAHTFKHGKFSEQKQSQLWTACTTHSVPLATSNIRKWEKPGLALKVIIDVLPVRNPMALNYLAPFAVTRENQTGRHVGR
jgi:hypothetical protein